MPTPLTIMFWPESAYGPTNQCIGLAAILRDRGDAIVFAAERSWAATLAPLGFVEELVDLAEPAPADGGDEDAAGSGPTSSPKRRRSSASRPVVLGGVHVDADDVLAADFGRWDLGH